MSVSMVDASDTHHGSVRLPTTYRPDVDRSSEVADPGSSNGRLPTS